MNLTEAIDKFKKNYPVDIWADVGLFNEKYIQQINIHWLQFDPPNRSSFYILAILYIFIMIIGWLGNLVVIIIYFKCKSLRTSANMLIVNLAISDIILMSKMPIFIVNSFYEGPVLGDIACRIYGLIGGLTGTVSIFTLSAIALDRFLVIKYPLNRRFSTERVKVCLVLVWVYGLTFSVIPSIDFGWGRYTPEGYLTSCSFDYLTPVKEEKIFILVYFFAAWVFPFLIITFSYINILQVVMTRNVAGKKERESFRHVREEDKRKQEIKLSLIVFCVIILWFAAWTPYAVVALLGIADKKDLINPLTSMVPALFCKTASAMDPFVYALSHPNFKKEIKSFFFKYNGETKKVFSITKPPKKNFEDTREVVSEVETVDVPQFSKSVTETTDISNANTEASLNDGKQNMSITELICFRPNFSNRSSSVRRMARRWSMVEKNRRAESECED